MTRHRYLLWLLVVLGVLTAGSVAHAAMLSFVAQTAINRPVGYQNMFNAEDIAFVPGSLYGPGQADRLILVNADQFAHQSYISAWRVDSIAPGTLAVSEAQTVLANNAVLNFGGHLGASFVNDPAHPHLLLAKGVWAFASYVAVIDVDLDLASYKSFSLARPGGGDYARGVAWDPTHTDATGYGLIYDGMQSSAKLILTRKLTGGYPPTASTTTTGYTDPAEISGVVNARTWSATTSSFFTALEGGTTLFETDPAGALLASTDIASYLPTGHTITGLANDDINGRLYVMSNKKGVSGSITVFAIPEPATLALLAFGAMSLLRRRR